MFSLLVSTSLMLASSLPLCAALALPAPAADRVTTVAQAYLGEHYVYGDIGASGYDCSSFVQTVFRQSGIVLPRSSRQQVRLGQPVALADVRAGDLLFFTSRVGERRISHVGIALPGNRMIHAARGKHRVVISRWDSRYFLERWSAARRPYSTNQLPPGPLASSN